MSTVLQHNTPLPNLDAEDAVLPYSAGDFARLAAQYPDLRMELTAEGEIVIMPPTVSNTGRKNMKIARQLANWAEEHDTGEVFDSSSGFTLPDGAAVAPDVCWVEKSRWQALTEDEQEEFSPLCPDFVLELRSKHDRLAPLQKKMRQYLKNGAQLGFLIDPRLHRVEVYRPNTEPVVLNNPASVSADPELPGFVLELTDILA